MEPGNAAAAGVNLPALQVALTLGEEAPPATPIGRPGVRTHGLLALLAGAAEAGASRCGLSAELAAAALRRGTYAASAEQLTPVVRDPPSAAALAFVVANLLARPGRASTLAAAAVSRYSIGLEAVARVRGGRGSASSSSPCRPGRSRGS